MAAGLPPPPINSPSGSYYWLEWYTGLTNFINGTNIPWGNLNFTGSNIADIQARAHNSLSPIQGGDGISEYYHLTLAQFNSLPGGSTESANTVLAGPTSGSAATPAFRALVTADVPSTLGSTTLPIVTITSNSGLRVTSQTNGAGTSVGTLTNAPGVGNPTFWLPVTINGTNHFIPCW